MQRSNIITLFILFEIVLPYVYSDIANVTLEEFNGNKKCLNGYFIKDQINLHGKIIGHAPLDRQDGEINVHIFNTSDKLSDRNKFETVFFKNCDEKEKNTLSCIFPLNDTIHTLYNESADIIFQNQSIQMRVLYNDKEYFSNIMQFPAIIDPTRVKLKVNGSPFNYSNKYTSTNEKSFEVCCVDAPEPCYVHVFNNSKTTVAINLTCVTITKLNLDKNIYSFGYNICGFEKLPKDEDKVEGKEINENPDVLKIVVPIIVILVFIIILWTIYCCRYSKIKVFLDGATQKSRIILIGLLTATTCGIFYLIYKKKICWKVIQFNANNRQPNAQIQTPEAITMQPEIIEERQPLNEQPNAQIQTPEAITTPPEIIEERQPLNEVKPSRALKHPLDRGDSSD